MSLMILAGYARVSDRDRASGRMAASYAPPAARSAQVNAPRPRWHRSGHSALYNHRDGFRVLDRDDSGVDGVGRVPGHRRGIRERGAWGATARSQLQDHVIAAGNCGTGGRADL
ncbi:hypothetical protein HNR30_002115 [Nonomuraea soli]|uniref:Uncharacterized protein n=1 Tax=Nonomuraea soli TaxID=1032476 RepID=A0A7W0CGU7_9ACTN|nr:hypothetical protein [Nonomuraea soli]